MASNQGQEKSIRKFFGGISDDVREQTYTAFSISKHFDTITSPNQLIPYRDTEADQDTTFLIKNFIYANTNFWGLGRTVANDKTKIYYKNATPISGTWTAAANGEAANNDTTYTESFEVYKNYLWGIRTGNVWKYGDITGAATFTQNALALGSTVVYAGPPIVHPIADRLFLPYNNILAQVDGSTPTDNVFVCPANTTINSLTPWGESLAIANRSSTLDITTSRVYLWNMIDADPYEMIDWGQEDLRIIENIDNQIIGVSLAGDSSFNFKQVLYVKSWSGGDVIKIKEIELDTNDYTVSRVKRLNQNRLYFSVYSPTSTAYTGIWVVGRKNEDYPWQVTMDRLVDNDSTVTSIQAIYKLGDYMWAAHSNNGSVDRTNDSASYTATSIFDTQRYNSDDPSRQKRLRGVAVSYVALGSSAQCVLKYRKDEETSFTTIFTETTDNTMSTEVTAISTNASLPEFHEIQFRIESTGGAQITELRFLYDLLGGPFD